ncbi:MAG: FAD-dependent oxidoreductase, partial [Delftia sp.]|nr:FAD-dependent oxidoreductase [Delftia sp.]
EAQERVLSQMGDSLSQKSERRMGKMGIELMLGAQVSGMSDRGVEFAGEQEPLPCETLVWTAGVRAHPLLDSLPLEKDRMGRVLVGSDLSAPGSPNVYVLGDAAHARHPQTDKVYPPTAQVAYRQAGVAAANIHADLLGGPRRVFDLTYIGDLVSLGSWSGVADPFGLKLWGPPAWLTWKFSYLLPLIGWQNRLRVAVNWFLALFSPLNSSLPHQCTPDCDTELCL